MRVLAVNCGSSTLKFQLLDVDEATWECSSDAPVAHGIVDRIGGSSSLEFATKAGGPLSRETIEVSNHRVAMERVLGWLNTQRLLEGHGMAAVGHRVVHGGDRFVEPTPIDDRVIGELESVSSLAPLHNRPALSAIEGAREVLGEQVPMVAVFDTAFHRTMPDRASRYAIPRELADRHGIRRYGFHGIAHRYMTERYCRLTSTPVARVRLITLQLGNGCSATAVQGGRSIDTSMGFTPLEGLMMGTRCGDVDPSLAGFIASREHVDIEEAERWLNTRSGLLGVSNVSADMRELLDAERAGDSRAALAIDMFCYRVRKYLGGYLAALGGADAVVFGGGIGENSTNIRARICTGMEWCGLSLDAGRNADAVGIDANVAGPGATTGAYVIRVNEAAIIASDTARCLKSGERG